MNAADPPLDRTGRPSDLDVLTSMNVAFELSTVAMILVDDALLIVAANPAAHRMFAVDPLIGLAVTKFSAADNVERADRENQAWLSGELTHLERETDLVAGNGTTLRAVISLDAVTVPTGRRFFLGQLRDVTTERRQAKALAASEAQYHQLAHEFGQFGGSSYDRRTGWTYDPALLTMWGIDDTAEISGLPLHLLVPEDRAADSAGWAGLLREQGRHTLSYTINHGLDGELRQMQCTTQTEVDADGDPLSVIATHVDVTTTVAAGKRVELARTTAAQERSRLLRQLGDILATSRLGPDQLLQSVVDLAARTVGEGAAIRILTPDHRAIERDVISHPDESIRLRLAASLRSAQEPVPDDGLVSDVVERGLLLSDFQQRDWRPEYQRIFAERVFDQAAHMMIAPVRHKGVVLGKLAIFRTSPDTPYQAGDDDVLQLLADGAGTAIAENRTWQKAEGERNQRLANLRAQHQGLLENLAGIETRERSLVAEAIHDEPIQSIVAGILRLDHLSTQLDSTKRTELNDITEQLVTTVDWLRQLIVVALTPPDLSRGLGPALADLANSIFTATPTVFTVTGLDHVPLSVTAKEASYRIFREALANVRKHANARSATLRLAERDGHVVISLTDDGDGSTSMDAGTGHFGMATMRARADAEGGQLHVESVSGLGTVITLSLPALLKEEAEIAGVAGIAPQSMPVDFDCMRTIVVCDDHQYLRDAVKLVLDAVPRFRIVGEASDGRTCLERVRKFRPDVLILDVSMPGGGPQLAEAARELNPDMHIVVFSGRQDEQTRTAMFAAGADQYIVKTGRLQPLVEALDEAISTAQRLPGLR